MNTGSVLGFTDTDDIIDFTTIGYQIDVDRGLLPTNDIVSVYFGADALPTGRNGIPNAATAGLLVSFVQGRYLQIQRMDDDDWLTEAGAWVNTDFTAVKDLGADGAITGEFVLEVGYSKGLLIVRAGDTDVYNGRLPSAPDLDGNQFGILVDYEAEALAPAGSYIGIQGFAIHDLTPEIIDPHSHAGGGGGTAPESWAEDGNTDLIPATKLPIAHSQSGRRGSGDRCHYDTGDQREFGGRTDCRRKHWRFDRC